MRSILLVCTRRIGDVLLVTALLRSLRLAYPGATIDVLVNRASAVALDGNPDVRERIVVSEPARGGETWGVVRRIFRRYELSISTLSSDRPHLLAWLAAPRRVSIVPPAGQSGARWKRWLTQSWTPLDTHVTHAVIQYLRLADCLHIPRHWQLVPPRSQDTAEIAAVAGAGWRQARFAVLHPAPMFRYKSWTVEGWRGLIRWLASRAMRVVLTGGPSTDEQAYVRRVLADLDLPADVVINSAGRLSFAALTPLIEGAAVFVGPDTSVTHLAAATGRPTVALFGPSSPVAWGPWPQGFSENLDSPWTMTAPLQQRKNVWIVQGITHCVPCLQEGCDRRPDSRADCLDQLPLSRVVAVVERALAANEPAQHPLR